MLLTPQIETLSPLDPQTLYAWGGANSATRPLAYHHYCRMHLYVKMNYNIEFMIFFLHI